MAIIFISLLPIFSFSLTFLIIILSHFQHISSPSGHHEFNFDHSLFSLFFFKIKTHFTKGEKTNSTLNTAKFHRFIDLAETANRDGSLTSSQIFICIEFQDSKLGGVRLVGKLTLPATTSMNGPSLDSIIFRSKFPHEPGPVPRFYHLQVQIPSWTRATNLPCFVKGESTYNFYLQSYFPINFSHVFTLPGT